MKITQRFLVSILVMFIFFTLLSWVSISIEYDTAKIAEYHNDMGLPAITTLEQISTCLAKMHIAIHGYGLDHDHALPHYIENKNKLETLIDKYEALTYQRDSAGEYLAPSTMQNMMLMYVNDMRTLLLKYDENAQKLFESVDSDSTILDKQFEIMDSVYADFTLILEKDKAMEFSGAKLEQEKLSDFLILKTNILYAILTFGLLAIIVLPLYNILWVKKRIMRIKNNLLMISNSDFEKLKLSPEENNELYEIEKQTKEVAEKLLEYKTRILADERIESIGKLSANMAHDLRNPLSVLTNSILILEHSDDPTAFDRMLPKIKRSIERMSHQVNDVLNFIQIHDVEKSRTSLLTTFYSAVDSLLISENISITAPDVDVYAFVDEEKIEVVFANLIHNSVMSIGDDPGTISLDITQKDNEILITLTDSGDLSDEHLEKMFDPLFTTKQKGTGLGLSSCKKIIETHGGSIWAKNNPTRMFFTIPNENQI